LADYLEKNEKWQELAYLLYTYSTGCRRTESRLLLKEVVNYEPVVKTKEVVNEDGEKEIKQVKYYLTHEIRCKGAGKIGKVRKLKFDQRAMDALKKWLEIRGEDDCHYMFITKHKGEVKQTGETTFNYWCHNIFEPVIGRRIHCHLFRESKATNLVVYEGKSIETAQSLLGHNSSETTKIYVIKDDTDDADDAFFEN
jgi:integrase